MLDKEYWNDLWKFMNTGWDIGYPSPPLMEFLDNLKDKNIKILIPGSGSGYEAEAAHKAGFNNVYYNDISTEASLRFKHRYPEFPDDQILTTDFYTIKDKFDIILEQTSFCAQPPSRRVEYVNKAHELLTPEGLFAGVLFDVEFNSEGPPYGGSKKEYMEIFSQNFEILKMEMCYNSINPRQGKELFVILRSQ